MNETEAFLKGNFQLETVDPQIVTFCHHRAEGIPATLACLMKSLLDNDIFVINDERNLKLNPTKVTDPSQLEKLETPKSVHEVSFDYPDDNP